MKLTPNPLPDPTQSIEGEHRFQIQLINLLNDAVEAGKPKEEISSVLTQLYAYSEAHFMSEELLMRLDSYDEYQSHVDEHQEMVQMLKDMVHNVDNGNLNLLPGKVQSALAFLVNHINTSDRRYVTHR